MINLLPPENIKSNLRTHRQKQWIVAAYFLLSLIIISAMIVALSYWLLVQERERLMNELAAASNPSEQAEYRELNQTLRQAIDQLAILRPEEHAPMGLPATVDKLDAYAGANLDISSVSYQARGLTSSLAIRGEASTRAGLLTFIDELKSDESFAVVDSPLSNLIQDKNLNYVLQIETATTTKS
ncbi:MAG: hypothetical protein U9M92_01290 [Patescibacteria group bacterium]|nr:hypothetical protein [Patescibacteria group bacterium]